MELLEFIIEYLKNNINVEYALSFFFITYLIIENFKEKIDNIKFLRKSYIVLIIGVIIGIGYSIFYEYNFRDNRLEIYKLFFTFIFVMTLNKLIGLNNLLNSLGVLAKNKLKSLLKIKK